MANCNVEITNIHGQIELVPPIIYHGTNKKYFDIKKAENHEFFTPLEKNLQIYCARSPERAFDEGKRVSDIYHSKEYILLVVFTLLAKDHFLYSGNEEGDPILSKLPHESYRVFECLNNEAIRDGTLDSFIQTLMQNARVTWKGVLENSKREVNALNLLRQLQR